MNAKLETKGKEIIHEVLYSILTFGKLGCVQPFGDEMHDNRTDFPLENFHGRSTNLRRERMKTLRLRSANGVFYFYFYFYLI